DGINAPRAATVRRRLRMQRLPSLQHRDKLGDSARSRLTLDRRLNAVEDRVSVRARQRLEERARLRTLVERRLEVGRYRRHARGIVSAFPPTVRLGRCNSGQAGGVHLAGRDQPLHVLAVSLRPWTSLLPRGELL